MRKPYTFINYHNLLQEAIMNDGLTLEYLNHKGYLQPYNKVDDNKFAQLYKNLKKDLQQARIFNREYISAYAKKYPEQCKAVWYEDEKLLVKCFSEYLPKLFSNAKEWKKFRKVHAFEYLKKANTPLRCVLEFNFSCRFYEENAISLYIENKDGREITFLNKAHK